MTAVVGSYKNDVAFSRQRSNMMMRQTVEESVDKLQELVRDYIEPFTNTGELWASVKKSEPKRVSASVWQGKVYSDLEYAAAIEYGMSTQRFIRPKKFTVKWFNEKTGKFAYSPGHFVAPYAGHHMFLKAATQFERQYAEDIAAGNARIWLGTIDAGRRTVAF